MCQTHYANTDLELDSNREPTALKAVFDQQAFCEMWERYLEDGQWTGCYETGEQYAEPNANIIGFLSVIEALEERALNEWDACTRRQFDIGYIDGHEPFDFSQSITSETLIRMAKVGTSLRITIYAADREAIPSTSSDAP